MKTVERTAVYTGGGIYLFTGRFEDGRCFFFDNVVEQPYIMILDEVPDIGNDEQMQYEWQASHRLDALEDMGAIEVIIPIFREILQYGCTGNYNYNDWDIMDEAEAYGKEYLNLLRKSY